MIQITVFSSYRRGSIGNLAGYNKKAAIMIEPTIYFPRSAGNPAEKENGEESKRLKEKRGHR
jgi:hypothetical protein